MNFLVRIGVLLLAPLFCMSSFAQSPATYQQRFEQGVQFMQTDIDQAVVEFRALYAGTEATRVPLELARSLYIAEDLDMAKAEFIDILQKPIPITVRDKVEWYLSEIQKGQSAKFYIRAFQDSIPEQITSDRGFELFGQLFEYQPPTPTKGQTQTQTASSLVAEAERELGKRSGFYGAIGTQITPNLGSLQFNLKATFPSRDFGDVDPLSGQTRKDNGQIFYASLVKRDLTFLG